MAKKELTTWINHDGSVEVKAMPVETGFEINNYEGSFHSLKHILNSCFLQVSDNDIVKAKVYFQVTKRADNP